MAWLALLCASSIKSLAWVAVYSARVPLKQDCSRPFLLLTAGAGGPPLCRPTLRQGAAARLHTRRRSGPSQLRAPRWLAGQCPGAPEPGPLLKLAIPTAPCIVRAAPAGCLALSSYSNGRLYRSTKLASKSYMQQTDKGNLGRQSLNCRSTLQHCRAVRACRGVANEVVAACAGTASNRGKGIPNRMRTSAIPS